MKKLVALVAGIAFLLGIGLAVPQTFAQAPKEEKKGEMMDKKGEKKMDKKKADKKMDKMEKMEKKDKMEKKEEKK